MRNMRVDYFAGGIFLIAVAAMLALLPLFNGYNLIDTYHHVSFEGNMGWVVKEGAGINYSVCTTIIAVDVVLAIAGVALAIYGAVTKKE